MMEIHNYYWDFEIPWWNAAVDDPTTCMPMPRTMNYLHANFEGDELERRKEQIFRGLMNG